MKSLLLKDETAWLNALRQYQILDTVPEPAFDDLARLAAQLCNTPLAAVSLIDSNRLWFKGKVGLTVTELAGDFSLYAQALSQAEGMLEVRDTWADEEFAGNALVISEPYIRFYGGVPLVTDEGYTLGALCVMDHVPRALTTEQLSALRILGRAVMAEIQLRRKGQLLTRTLAERKHMEEAFQRREQKFRSLAENLPDIVARFDQNFRYLYINPAVESITGYAPEAFLRKTSYDLGLPEDLVRYWHTNLLQVFQTGKATTVEFAFPWLNNLRYFEGRIIPEAEVDGSIKTILTITRDITERKQAEAALQKQNRDLALLNRATQAFNSTLDLNQIWMKVLQEIRDLLEVTGGSVWLTDPKTNELVGWLSTLPEHNVIQGWRLEPGQGVAGWVVEQRRSLIVPDTRLESRHYKGVDRQTGLEVRSILSVPLLGQQEVIGVLQVVDTGVGRFKESDLELVELMVTTATIAFENASLFHALLDSEKRYRSLFEMAAIPLWEEDFSAAKAYLEGLRQAGVHDFRRYFQEQPEAVRHCANLVQLVDVNKAGMELYQADHKDEVLGSLGPRLTSETLPVFSEELVAVAEGRPRFACEAFPQKFHGTMAYVDISWSVVSGYEDNYQRVIVCLRDVTERVRAAEALRLYAERLSTLHEIDRAILTSQSAEAIAQTALAHLRQLIPCQRATVIVYDPEAGEAVLLAVDVDCESRIGPGSRLSLQEPWIIKLWHNKSQTFEYILPLSQTSPTLQALYAEGIRTFTCTPLIVQDVLIGSLNLGFAHKEPLAPEQMSIAQEVAASLAVAIHQARLWEAEQQAHQVAKTVQAANLALTQTLHLETVLETLLDYLIVLVPYDTASVLLLETETRLNRRAMRGYERWTDPALIPLELLDIHSHSNIETLLTSQTSLIIPDVREYPGWTPLRGMDYVCNWMGVPLRLGDTIIGLYSLSKAEPNFFTQKHLQLAETLATQAAVAIQNARLFEEVETGRQQLQALSHRLVEVQEAERRHLARELHDEVGEVLTGLKFSLEASARLPVKAVKSKLDEAQELVRNLMMRVEELSLNLRPAMLDDLGLLPTLLWHFERYTALTRVQVAFKHQGLGNRFSPEVETAAYRIVQEALTNIARHAQTGKAFIQISANQEILDIQVKDQGAGFELETALAAGASSGLAGMQERAILVGGYLMIESAPGKGTHLNAQLPLRTTKEG